MKKPVFYLRVLLAVVVGEITLGLLSALVQEVLFKGVFWTKSSAFDLIVGGLLTVLTAVIAGWVAALIVKRETYIPHVIISLLIIAETTWLIVAHKTPDPAWFDALAGLSLVVGIWLGGNKFIKLVFQTQR